MTLAKDRVRAGPPGDWFTSTAVRAMQDYMNQQRSAFAPLRAATVFAVGVLFLLAGCRGADGDFRSVRFGMTLAEVKAAESLTEVGEETSSHITYQRVLTSTLPGRSRLTKLTYEFVDSKLASACYELNPMRERVPSPELRQDYQTLAEQFTKTLGVEPEERRRVLSKSAGREDYDFFSVWVPVDRPAVGLRLKTDTSTSLGLPYGYRVCFAKDRAMIQSMADSTSAEDSQKNDGGG